jgi:Fe-S oxidoreductase
MPPALNFFEPFHQDRCNQCGQCFHQCPVMALPPDVARAEIQRLLQHQPTQHVLARCESCFSCNLICPEHANPARLILDRWNEAHVRDGFPARALYFMPHRQPNFRTFVVQRLPADERAMVRSWLDTSPAEQIFFPGCNWVTAPYLAKTRLLDGLAIRGGLELCCGEMYFRTGMYDQLRQVAARLKSWLGQMGTRRMLIPCTAGLNLFTNILPQFGFDYPLEVEHLLPWLMRRIDSGEIVIPKPLNLTVTIQDSCHAKAFGPDYLDLPRQLLSRLGVKVIERACSGDRTLCCGIGGGFSHPSAYNPIRLTTATLRNLRACRQTGADAIVTYCAGCAQMLATGQITNPLNRMPIYHVLELLQLAIGEPILPRSAKIKRALRFLLGVTLHQTPLLISPQNHRLPDLPPDL